MTEISFSIKNGKLKWDLAGSTRDTIANTAIVVYENNYIITHPNKYIKNIIDTNNSKLIIKLYTSNLGKKYITIYHKRQKIYTKDYIDHDEIEELISKIIDNKKLINNILLNL